MRTSSTWAFAAWTPFSPRRPTCRRSIWQSASAAGCTFRGCISTAGPLATGTPEDVTADCRHVLEVMMPTHGYHFAPTHCIQDNSPVENRAGNVQRRA